MTNEEKISKLMDITGKGPMACGISLSMAGGDYEAALERMKLVYPISVDIGPDIK